MATTAIALTIVLTSDVQYVASANGQQAVGASASLVSGSWPASASIFLEGSYDTLTWAQLVRLSAPGTSATVPSTHTHIRVRADDPTETSLGLVDFNLLFYDTVPVTSDSQALSRANFLGALRPAGTGAVELLAGDASVAYLTVCNTSGATAAFSLYHSPSGSPATFDESTALQWSVPVPVGDTVFVEFPAALRLVGGESVLGVQASVANALTFSAYGAA